MMGNGWGMGWMWFIGPLMVAGTVLLVVFLLRGNVTGSPGGGQSTPPPGSRRERSRAQEILDERYARGEISDEEYRDRLRHLRGEADG